jgi:putative ABC transport system permease protein
MKRSMLAAMCFIESLLMSIAGTVAGVAASIPVIIYFVYNPIRLSGGMADVMADYGFEPILPFSSAPEVFYIQAMTVLIISFMIGLYPVYKVFRLDVMKKH